MVEGRNAEGDSRRQTAKLRPQIERQAMGKWTRRLIKEHFTCKCNVSISRAKKVRRILADFKEDPEDRHPQYTLIPFEDRKSIVPFQRLRTKLGLTPGDKRGLNVNRAIAGYLSWSFRTSYFFLFIAYTTFYYFCILIFAVIFLLITMKYPNCINSGGMPLAEVGGYGHIFSDSFQLSWTTFSTVGYGVIFPSTGAIDDISEISDACIIVGVIGSLEAFMGVLYAAFCGSILFAKVTRAQSRAQVLFSDPLVVRFGKPELAPESVAAGADVERGGGADFDAEEEEEAVPQAFEVHNNIPCPSLEFRVVNRLHNLTAGGEIVEAKLQTVAIQDPKKSDTDVRRRTQLPMPKLRVSNRTTVVELVKAMEEEAAHNPSQKGIAFHSADSKQARIFTKIELESSQHPFFRRVWFGKHILNENSPLLTPAARRMVKENDGFWPEELNNFRGIKKSMHFRQLLVNFSGTSNTNAKSVYAQKVYDFIDVNIGYKFVPMNYYDDNGKMRTDPFLLNTVYQQRGGGAEPFDIQS